MIPRRTIAELRRRLSFFPGLVLLGPRQVGKSTLAREYAKSLPGAVFLDLEKPSDRAQLANPGAFFAAHRDRLIVLDEVQLLPQIFAQLRPEIDEDRRPGRVLLSGSASGPLLKQSAESLAGRVSYLELPPLVVPEVSAHGNPYQAIQKLWLRGGFPQSFTAPDDALSMTWRNDFIGTFLQRDLPELGVRLPVEALLRFWRMCAHLQGEMFNASRLGVTLGVAHTTVNRYLDTLSDVMMLRQLPPYYVNVGKRLVKSPKVYVRDSGIQHALLNIRSVSEMMNHPSIGHSWEGFIVENICQLLPQGANVSFYRTAAGAELDVVVEIGLKKIGIEIKLSSTPSVSKGFWLACEDVGVHEAYVVAPVLNGWPMAGNARVISPLDLPQVLLV
jgi:uncharacterized protein